jgi:hypothetical protein
MKKLGSIDAGEIAAYVTDTEKEIKWLKSKLIAKDRRIEAAENLCGAFMDAVLHGEEPIILEMPEYRNWQAEVKKQGGNDEKMFGA